MKLVLEGFDTTVYSRNSTKSGVEALVTSIGAKFVLYRRRPRFPIHREADRQHRCRLCEAVGASSLAFEVLLFFGVNGVFIFTGVLGKQVARFPASTPIN